MRAYEGTMTKAQTLAQLRAHAEADEIVQGQYWRDGKGCAVGCLTHDPTGGHDRFPDLFGVPTPLAYLVDRLFEMQTPADAQRWPLRIMSAIPAGTDLSQVVDRWLLWMLRDLDAVAGENRGVVSRMADLFERRVSGDEPSESEWREAARAAGAARAAWDAEDALVTRACDELVRLVEEAK